MYIHTSKLALLGNNCLSSMSLAEYLLQLCDGGPLIGLADEPDFGLAAVQLADALAVQQFDRGARVPAARGGKGKLSGKFGTQGTLRSQQAEPKWRVRRPVGVGCDSTYPEDRVVRVEEAEDL